jgi:pimeloyl-ACP methyl ester carboxylesterase
VVDRSIDVPLDWDDPDSPAIEVFFREISDPGRPAGDLPPLLFLQGGPGGQGVRPMPGEGWLDEALKHYRVVMPDQRGTGRSTPVDGQVISHFPDPAAAARHLSRFLADSIVKDFEQIRRRCYGGQRWHTLGQSYGGILTLAYLSQFPDALRGCYVAGGLPGLPPAAAEVYRRTFPRAKRKTEQFYARYPQDVALVAEVADRLAQADVRLPNGDPFSVPRLQSLGLDLGMKPGPERLHWLFDTAFARTGRLSEAFCHQVLARTSSAADPLFWTLQEFIYGCGANGPIGWAAHHELARHPEFAPEARPLMFTAEMTFPWMFEENRLLRPFKPAVEVLMGQERWPAVYRAEVLARNQVPLQAVVYHDDLYVDAGLQLATLDQVGNAQAWVTNEFEHDGVQTPAVFAKLRQLLVERGGGLPA